VIVSGAPLWQALRFIAGLSPVSPEFDLGVMLLRAPLDRWARMLTYVRLMYGEGPEYEAATAIEQILRGIEAAA
jgi:hypothetical protein